MINLCEYIRVSGKSIDDMFTKYSLYGSNLSNFGSLYSQFQNQLKLYITDLPSGFVPTITSSGHTAIMTALNILGSKKAVVPAYTFSSTFQAACLQGIETKIIDVDINTGAIGVQQLEQTYKTDFFDTLLYVCPLSSIPSDMKDVWEWCKSKQVRMIVDGAATFGSTGKHYHWCDIYCMSFHATKNLPIGECGCVIHPIELEEKARQFISFGMGKDKVIRGSGINAKVSEYTCAIGLVLLEGINLSLEGKKYNVSQYKRLLKDVRFLESQEGSVYSTFPFFCRTKKQALDIINSLTGYGYPATQYYKPLGDVFDNAMKLYNQSIIIPSHKDISANEIYDIVDIINKRTSNV